VLILVVLGALLAMAALVWLAVDRRRRRTGRRAVLVRAGAAVSLVLVAQALAVVGAALKVNDSYGFYASWNDLLGTTDTATTPIRVGNLVAGGQGRIVSRTIPDPRAGTATQVLVWLPPQYDEPAFRHVRLPVVMFLPGQPSTPQIAFTHFHFAQAASQQIASGRVPPFIGVFPSLEVSPPRDTECTNIPGGPRAESWLSGVVPHYVHHHFRAQKPGRDWSVMGFSTGGFCAAKLLLAHQLRFGSAASFGGYYVPLDTGTSGNLFGGSRGRARHNSPTFLYETRGLRTGHLLVIASRQDPEAWPDARRFLHIAGTDPRVASLVPAQGGHNYYTYNALLPTALRYVASHWRTRTTKALGTVA
jgi:hypothetical protein